MRGTYFLGNGAFETRDIPEHPLAPREVLIQVAACGVCGTDVHIYHGDKGSAEVIPPVVLGHELSGTVAAVGAAVKTLHVGDHVAVDPNSYCGECHYCRRGKKQLCTNLHAIGVNENGGFAEYVILPARHAFRLPEGVSLKTAALCEPLACVVRSVCERTTVHAGDYVLVSGAGVMAQLTAQVAHANGGVVIMTGLASDAERFAMAKRLGGVKETVRVDEDGALEKILALTGGMGPHVAYECAGVASSADFCLRALRKTGTYAQVAIPGKPIPMDMDMALYKEIVLTNSYASERTSWLTALSLLENHLINIDPLASTTLPLEQWEEGFRQTIAKTGFKVLLMPDPSMQDA